MSSIQSSATFFLFPWQFRYKKRVYKQSNLDEKQLARLHTKVWGVCWAMLPPPHQVSFDLVVLSLEGSFPWEWTLCKMRPHHCQEPSQIAGSKVAREAGGG